MAKDTQQPAVDTWSSFVSAMAAIKNNIGDELPVSEIYDAFIRAGGAGYMLNWPIVQNRRVKSINTRPAGYGKNDIEEMVNAPDGSELPLRQVSAALSYSTKTYDLIIQTYQDLMTYDWYIYPTYQANPPDKATKMREYGLAYKVANEMHLKAKAHEIVGKCVEFGKVFYTPRVSVDKTHNSVNYAFLQQIPEDYVKITGFNNGIGKYTVAFNLMYFVIPGNDWRQFGDLFEPYMRDFYSVVGKKKGRNGKYVYSSIDVEKFERQRLNEAPGAPEWAVAGSKWFYWVTLPADKIVTFEVNDRDVLVVPPTTGLMVSMTQIPNFEAAQLEIVLNPLTAILTGTLETNDTKGVQNADAIRVSPGTRTLFEKLWYQMLDANNTAGIGLYMAPATDLKLQTVSDSVSNTNIAASSYADQVVKSGLASLITTTNDPKVGVAQLSAKIQANYARPIYWAFERLMNQIFEEIGFKTAFRFRMFGDVLSREKEIEDARKGMTNGILADTMRYDALQGHSILDDIAISDFIVESGVMEKRLPLVTSYSAKQESGLPPQVAHDMNPGGRPAEEGSISSQVTEKLDSLSEIVRELG